MGSHLSSFFAKLNVDGRSQALIMARDVGRGRLPVKASPVLAVGLLALGVLLPLFGISLLVVLVVDQLVLRRVPRLGAWFNVA